MVILRCDYCGSENFSVGEGLYTCNRCGIQYTIPTVIQQFSYLLSINPMGNMNTQTSFMPQSNEFEINGGTLVKYNGKNQDVIVPDNVISIGPNAFRGQYITSIKLPSGLKSIQNNAFYGCKSLYSIELPMGLTEIGYEAFGEMTLSELSIPESVINFSGAFSGCTIGNLYIKYMSDEMKYKAFSYTEQINNVYILNGTEKCIDYISTQKFFRNKKWNIDSIFFPQNIDILTNLDKLAIVPANHVYVGKTDIEFCIDIDIIDSTMKKGNGDNYLYIIRLCYNSNIIGVYEYNIYDLYKISDDLISLIWNSTTPQIPKLYWERFNIEKKIRNHIQKRGRI